MSARLRNVPALARVRLAQTLRGTVSNLVKVKASANDPEAPMPGARVRMHRLLDGQCDWQGVSAADGGYTASGLRAGLSYVPVAIDPSDTYECVASGPVLAAADTRVAPVAQVYIGRAYSAELRVLNAALKITSLSVSGTLPSGVSRDGLVLHADWPTGTPGSYPLTVSVGQGDASIDLALALELVLLPLQIKADKQLPAMLKKDAAISTVTFTAAGGEGPYTFDVVGSLPSGLSLLDNEDGTATLSGTPDEVGAYSFAVRATDVRAATCSAPLVVAVENMKSYLAYRISVTANNGGGFAIFGGCQLRRSFGADPIDVSGATYFSTGSSGGDQWGPRKAFDGTPSSAAGSDSWASDATTTGTVGFILPAPALEPIQITMRSSGQSTHTNSAPKNFTIQASSDTTTGTDGTWVTLWSVTNQTGWGVAESRVFNR